MNAIDADTDAILALHVQDRRAHLGGDADLLVSGMADQVLEAGLGRLTYAAREQMRDRFAAYSRFESAWIAVYEKRDGPWLMVAISSSVAKCENACPRPAMPWSA